MDAVNSTPTSGFENILNGVPADSSGDTAMPWLFAELYTRDSYDTKMIGTGRVFNVFESHVRLALAVALEWNNSDHVTPA